MSVVNPFKMMKTCIDCHQFLIGTHHKTVRCTGCQTSFKFKPKEREDIEKQCRRCLKLVTEKGMVRYCTSCKGHTS